MRTTKRDLELENARLRGQIEALEKIVAAYRESINPMTPWLWPSAPPAAPPLLPVYVPGPSTFRDHGGNCACRECVGVITCNVTWQPNEDLRFTS